MARAREAKKAPRAAVKAAAKAASPAANRTNAAAGFDLAELRHLIRLVQKTGIGELELNSGGRSVRIAANAASGTWVAAPPAPPSQAAAARAGAAAAGAPVAEAEPVADDSRYKTITSPMVGTFYRSPAPDADPFVEVGDVIEVGQTVCIIEAMKLMNEIESEAKGRVVKVLVDNAQPVEFGQQLFQVEPL